MTVNERESIGPINELRIIHLGICFTHKYMIDDQKIVIIVIDIHVISGDDEDQFRTIGSITQEEVLRIQMNR